MGSKFIWVYIYIYIYIYPIVPASFVDILNVFNILNHFEGYRLIMKTFSRFLHICLKNNILPFGSFLIIPSILPWKYRFENRQ